MDAAATLRRLRTTVRPGPTLGHYTASSRILTLLEPAAQQFAQEAVLEDARARYRALPPARRSPATFVRCAEAALADWQDPVPAGALPLGWTGSDLYRQAALRMALDPTTGRPLCWACLDYDAWALLPCPSACVGGRLHEVECWECGALEDPRRMVLRGHVYPVSRDGYMAVCLACAEG